MAVTTVTTGTGNNATVPTGTGYPVVHSNQGETPVVVVGYVDGSDNVQTPTDASGIPVQGTTTISGVTSTTASTSAVADTASSTTLIASNASRVGFSITNTSSAVLYVKFGSTASSTSFVKRLEQYDQVGSQLLGLYTGIITGIWASDPNDGSAICTEW